MCINWTPRIISRRLPCCRENEVLTYIQNTNGKDLKGGFSISKYKIKIILCTHDICVFGKQFRTARLRKVMGPLHQWLLESKSYSVFTDLQGCYCLSCAPAVVLRSTSWDSFCIVT